MKPSKYKAIRTTNAEGVTFASRAEARRDGELQLLERAGQIKFLTRQPRFPLVVCGVKVCTYVGDWEYREPPAEVKLFDNLAAWRRIVEDKKGVKTAAFRIKWALVKALHPEIEWRLS